MIAEWTPEQGYEWARRNGLIENRWWLPSPPAKRCTEQMWGVDVARLPSNEFLIQQLGDGQVILFRDGSDPDEILVRYDPRESNSMAAGIRQIWQSVILDDQDKAFACLWVGYFYGFTAYPEDGRAIPEWARSGWETEADPRAGRVLALYDEFAGDMTESTDPESRMGSFRAELVELLGQPAVPPGVPLSEVRPEDLGVI